MTRRRSPGRARTSSPGRALAPLSRAHDGVLSEQSRHLHDVMRLHNANAVQPVYTRALAVRTAFLPRRVRKFTPFLTKRAVGALPRERGLRDVLRRINVPSYLMFCVRREIRKQVMFAYRVAGRGGKRGRRFRRSLSSEFSCG